MRGSAVHHRVYAAVVALAAVIGTSATFVTVAAQQSTAATTTVSPATTGTDGAATNTVGSTGDTANTGNTGTANGTDAATTGTTTTTTTSDPAPPPPSGDVGTGGPAAAGATGAVGSTPTPAAAAAPDSALIASGAPNATHVDPSSVVVGGTVTWTGNGTNNGQCGSEENLDVTVPPGQQAWLFILTSPGTGPFTLTTNLNGNVPVTGTQMGNGAVHFIVFSALGATLTSASAVTGTTHSVLTVSGCQFGTPLVSGSTTSTVVFDATSGAPWSGDESVGATAYDTSTVTPTTPDGPTPTGHVTYTFFTNGSCDGSGAPETVMLNADGTVPHSKTSLPLAAGQYSYDAVYSGDPNYGPSPVSMCEPLSVAQTTPTIRTVVFNAATNLALVGGEPAGTQTYDTSTLSALIVGFAPTGTVTYTFFPNGTCTGPGTTETVTIAAGAVPNSPTSLTLPAGSYSYDAVYSGDGNYHPSAPGVCEPFSLAPNTAGSTTNGSVTAATSATTSGGTVVAATPATRPATTASVAGSALAFTGADLSAMFAAGLVLMATGSALVLESRRRRRA